MPSDEKITILMRRDGRPAANHSKVAIAAYHDHDKAKAEQGKRRAAGTAWDEFSLIELEVLG